VKISTGAALELSVSMQKYRSDVCLKGLQPTTLTMTIKLMRTTNMPGTAAAKNCVDPARLVPGSDRMGQW
jgi:hypothetical protein